MTAILSLESKYENIVVSSQSSTTNSKKEHVLAFKGTETVTPH